MIHLCNLIVIYPVVHSCTDTAWNTICSSQSTARHDTCSNTTPCSRWILVGSGGESASSVCTMTTSISVVQRLSSLMYANVPVVATIHVGNEQLNDARGKDGGIPAHNLVCTCLHRGTGNMGRSAMGQDHRCAFHHCKMHCDFGWSC